jgi:PAS domain S-box-containing protein
MIQAVRLSLLVSADGVVTSVSDGATHLDPRLREGASFESIEALNPVRSAVVEARTNVHSERSVRIQGYAWEVTCELASSGSVFVTLTRVEEHAIPTLGNLELVDVVLSGEPLPRILDELCRVAGSLAGARCAVLVLGEDGLLHFGGGPTIPAVIRDLCRNLGPGEHNGACAAPAFTKRPAVAEDVLTDAQFAPFSDVVRNTPIRSCWAWPIITYAGEVLGSFVAFADSKGLPSEAQAGVMGTLVRFPALAIEHARNERSTREMLDRYHLATEASTNVIYDWSLRNNRLEWSPRMRQVFGYDETHALSFDWWESCVHPADRERVVNSLQEAIIDRRRSWNETYRFRRKSGTWATVIDRGHLLFDESGSPARLIGELSDVSGQMQLQARLALTERLASVGTLAAGVAHEINNPLAWITSNVQYVLEELAHQPRSDDFGDVLAALNDARTGAERVSTIVRDLKMFSRAQDEQTSLVDVRRVLESSITMVRNEIRHRAHLERRFEEVPLVRGNEGKLSQVFLNLLINAAHAVPEGDVANHSIVVSTGVDVRGNVLVQVQDTGKGISPEVLPKIFDPFFTTKPVGQGTGLGLSICHSIVAGLGGAIQVESAPGRGSTFRVTLPIAAPEVRKTPLPSFEPVVNSARGVVALIDDEPSVLMALQRVLGPHHDVKTFSEPKRALDALPMLKPDVIFCDVMMPEMSGAEVYNRLRASHPTLADRLVFMTGGAFSASAREFLDDVHQPVLDKPFTADAVRRIASERVALVRTSR